MDGGIRIGVADALLDLSDNNQLATLVRLRAEMARNDSPDVATLDRGALLRVTGRSRIDAADAILDALASSFILSVERSEEFKTWRVTLNAESLVTLVA